MGAHIKQQESSHLTSKYSKKLHISFSLQTATQTSVGLSSVKSKSCSFSHFTLWECVQQVHNTGVWRPTLKLSITNALDSMAGAQSQLNCMEIVTYLEFAPSFNIADTGHCKEVHANPELFFAYFTRAWNCLTESVNFLNEECKFNENPISFLLYRTSVRFHENKENSRNNTHTSCDHVCSACLSLEKIYENL